jgi:nicotinamidase-related amidase
VVHVGTFHADEDSLPRHQRRRVEAEEGPFYCQEGTPGAAFVVVPAAHHGQVRKRFYSAFDETTLDAELEGVTEILFAGVATDCCILRSVFDADRRGFRALLPYQAVSASTMEGYVGGLSSMAKAAGDVVDLAVMLAGESVEGAKVKVPQVATIARAWFESERERARNFGAVGVEELVRRLG